MEIKNSWEGLQAQIEFKIDLIVWKFLKGLELAKNRLV